MQLYGAFGGTSIIVYLFYKLAGESMAAYNYIDHTYDVVVVGAGGSGLRATLGMAEQGLKTAVSRKFFQQEAILLQLRAELLLHYPTWDLIIGSGICMIR